MKCNFKKLDILHGAIMDFKEAQRKYELCTLKQLNGLCDGEKNCIVYQLYISGCIGDLKKVKC